MSSKYILRLDDACEKRNIEKWEQVEFLLDKYNIKPLVGVIPKCEDPEMDKYPFDNNFWNKVDCWKKKEWEIALHGFKHVYSTNEGGINPVIQRSEFAGEPLEVHKDRIRNAVTIFKAHGLSPKVFFAPSHTFDENTLIALKEESNIRIISDTIARDLYRSGDFIFVPQQTGRVRTIPFLNVVTFCYHPNTMNSVSLECLDSFIAKYNDQFYALSDLDFENVKTRDKFDLLLSNIYFRMHK